MTSLNWRHRFYQTHLILYYFGSSTFDLPYTWRYHALVDFDAASPNQIYQTSLGFNNMLHELRRIYPARL